jgi:hypothetical protein
MRVNDNCPNCGMSNRDHTDDCVLGQHLAHLYDVATSNTILADPIAGIKATTSSAKCDVLPDTPELRTSDNSDVEVAMPCLNPSNDLPCLDCDSFTTRCERSSEEWLLPSDIRAHITAQAAKIELSTTCMTTQADALKEAQEREARLEGALVAACERLEASGAKQYVAGGGREPFGFYSQKAYKWRLHFLTEQDIATTKETT